MDTLKPTGQQKTDLLKGNVYQDNGEYHAMVCGDVGYSSASHFSSSSPIDGYQYATVGIASKQQINQSVQVAEEAFKVWRLVPAPRRGELVRQIGEEVRANKKMLAQLITLEAGKIIQEAEGEVQEWIDMCDFAVGVSRQLYGLTIASERPSHRMMEQWHPLGVVGVITAFNFPMAVWAWNAMLALVCGDAVVWKPSEKTPLCAYACHEMFLRAAQKMDDVPLNLCAVVQGDASVGSAICDSSLVKLVSATGSVAMGRKVAQTVSKRLGKYLLELGGNNAMIVTAKADLDLAVRAIVFAAVGTCGQRCTSLRRLIIHESIFDELMARLVKVYPTLPIGDPRKEGTLIGPLIDEAAFQSMQLAIQRVTEEKGKVLYGGERVDGGLGELAQGFYVRPALSIVDSKSSLLVEETFAPVLFCLTYSVLEEAIELHNAVPQGLSSAIFTQNVMEAESFVSTKGSDCGIANVNIGTSGAEIGGAFGGEKDTGGGRESGSDAWKNYMRRATNTINYGYGLPFAQGVSFSWD